MIKFFRKIRQNLLNQGKTSKYLTYAIGEIFLVVIGILIALQINTWNDNRINAQKETAYIKSLKADVKVNIDQFDQYQYILKTKLDVLDKIIKEKYDAISKVNQMSGSISDIFVTRYQYSLPLQDNTYKELLSTGNLSILRSEILKKNIFDYYLFINDRKSSMQSSRSEWPNMLSGMIPAEFFHTGVESDKVRVIGSPGYEQFLQRLKDDIEILRPFINEEVQYASRAYEILSQMKIKAKEIIEVLDEALED